MSAMQTPPPPDAPAATEERRCPRCGSAMSPDQEWCLACGAAATTEVAEPRGWRVPIMLTGAIVLLGVIGIVLAIVALSGGGEKLGQATPTPSAAAPPPTTTPAPTASPTVSPLPTETTTPDPNGTPDPNATTTPDPNATTTPDPNATPDATSTPDNGGTGAGSTFTAWPGGSGWTVIIESASTQSKAESVATSAQGKGHTVGILNSGDYSSLNPGYYVVFTEKYSSKSAAEDGLSSIKSDYPDAYVRQVKP
jgi:predicted nucleic acid-binding Zn ribbon protein